MTDEPKIQRANIPGTTHVPDRTDVTQDILARRSTIKLFAGSAGEDLVQEIAQFLNASGYDQLKPGEYTRAIFKNENIFIRLEESVRGQDVYLVQTMCPPVHDNIMEMLIMIDALKRDSAKRINVIFPYMSYARSDKKDQPRVPITARLLANMIEVAGADRYVTVDLHSGQIQGFFNIPGDALTAFHLLSDYVRDQDIPDLVVASADLGYVKQGRNWAEKLGTRLVIVEKRRSDNRGTSTAMSLIGDVEGANVLLVDDEVLTGGSVVNAVNILRDAGARDIYLAFTHGLLADGAVERLASLDLKEIILANTIPVPLEKQLANMTILSIAPMLAEVIRRAHEGRSVGELFNE
jgi:ribose-phosphate pyrophosphokinase